MLKNKLTCIGLLFIGCSLSFYYIDYQNNIEVINDNELLMEKFYTKRKSEYVAILEIPNIKFKRGLYNKESSNNIIDKNIVFLNSSDMPSEINSRVVIVGHSGDDSNSYFKNLYKLKRTNLMHLYYENYKYTYKISDIYEVKKTGTIALESKKDISTLVLVTCKGYTKQLVIIGELINKKRCY